MKAWFANAFLRICVGVGLVIIGLPAHAAPPPVVAFPPPYVPLGYVQISPASATALAPPSGATVALVVCTGQTVNWRDDGTAPTAGTGMPLPVNQQAVFSEPILSNVQLIQTAASATCNVSYEK